MFARCAVLRLDADGPREKGCFLRVLGPIRIARERGPGLRFPPSSATVAHLGEMRPTAPGPGGAGPVHERWPSHALARGADAIRQSIHVAVRALCRTEEVPWTRPRQLRPNTCVP